MASCRTRHRRIRCLRKWPDRRNTPSPNTLPPKRASSWKRAPSKADAGSNRRALEGGALAERGVAEVHASADPCAREGARKAEQGLGKVDALLDTGEGERCPAAKHGPAKRCSGLDPGVVEPGAVAEGGAVEAGACGMCAPLKSAPPGNRISVKSVPASI